MDVPHQLPRTAHFRRRGVIAVVAAGLLGAATAVALAGPAHAGTTLRAAAAERGRQFGVAVQASKLTDATYVSILDREFGMVTPENELKFDATEPARGSFNFAPADRIVAHAQAQGQRVRGSFLVSPDAGHTTWLTNISNSELPTVMRDHITGVMTHYRGVMSAWDVVTEAFDDAGRLRQSFWSRQGLNTVWIEDAFRTARAADPAARLCYNDYNTDSLTSAKTQAVLALVADFKARGVPIDCVGLESHFVQGIPVPADYQATLERFAALGVEVQITELDITGTSTQAADYARVVRACLAVPACTSLTVWGVRDSDSWMAGNIPLLFDSAGAPKPAYTAVLAALNEPGTPTSAPPTSTAPTSTAPTSTVPTSRPPTSAVPTSTVPTSRPPTSAVPTTGVAVTCAATVSVQDWGSGFVATVRVTAGARATTRWAVTVALPAGATVVSAWGATPGGRTGTVRFTDAGYNGRIPAGGSTEFGFRGTGRGTGTTVRSCTAA